MKNSSVGPGKSGTPTRHPRAEGLENTVSSAVKAELDQRGVTGGSGGGGRDDVDIRLKSLETDVAIIKNTMVTKDVFEERAGKIEIEVSKVPFETIKWLVGTIIALGIVVFATVRWLSTS